jgi:hypothetical protein
VFIIAQRIRVSKQDLNPGSAKKIWTRLSSWGAKVVRQTLNLTFEDPAAVPQHDLFDFDYGTNGQFDFLLQAFLYTEGVTLAISSPVSDGDRLKCQSTLVKNTIAGALQRTA